MNKQRNKISEGWKEIELSNENYFKLIMGQSPPSSSYNSNKRGLPFLQGNAEFGDMYPDYSKYTTQPIRVTRKNDILISVRAPVGEINLSKGEICIGRGLGAIRILNGNYLFYYYYLNYIKKKIKKLGQGSTFQAITGRELNKIHVPLLEIKEQEAISLILSKVDEQIDIIERERHATERLKEGIMVKLLGKKNLVIVGEYINVIPGFAFSSKLFNSEKKGLPLIRIRDLSKKETECYYKGDYSKDYLVNKGDILIGMDGEFNTILWKGETALLNQRVCKILPKENNNLDKSYLYYVIQKPIKILESQTGQTTVKHLSTKDFYKIKIPLPPLPEQQQIANILSTIDKKLELERNRKGKLERLKKGLMNELLTGNKRLNVEKVLEVRK